MSCCSRITKMVPGVVGTLAGSSLQLRWVIIDGSGSRVGTDAWPTVGEADAVRISLALPGSSVVAAYV